MTADAGAVEAVHTEVLGLMAGGAGSHLAGIVRLLRAKYPDATADAEDAVYQAVASFLSHASKGGDHINDPAGWMFVVAKRNLLKRIQRQQARETNYDSAQADRSSEDTVLENDTYRYVKSLLERWESRRLKAVTLLYLESEYLGEPITQVEAAEQVSLLLDEDVPWSVIGKTRQRGFFKLRAELLQIAQDTGINPLDGSELS